MFEHNYDQVLCKNIDELIYVNNVAKKLGKIQLREYAVRQMTYPVYLFLQGDTVGWNDSMDRIGDKFTFLEFVEWEQTLNYGLDNQSIND